MRRLKKLALVLFLAALLGSAIVATRDSAEAQESPAETMTGLPVPEPSQVVAVVPMLPLRTTVPPAAAAVLPSNSTAEEPADENEILRILTSS